MTKKLFSKVIRNSMIYVLQMTLAVRCFLVLKGLDSATVWAVFIVNALLVFLGFGHIVDSLLSHQLDSAEDSLDAKLQMMVHLPFQKSLELFLLTFLYAVICTATFFLLYHLRGVSLYVTIVAWLFISGSSSAEAFLTANRAVSRAFEDLILSDGGEVRRKLFENEKKKFLGISLSRQFSIYVLIPIILCFFGLGLLFVEELYVENFHLAQRMAIMTVLTVGMVVTNSLNFFLYVKRTARRIESVVDKIQRGEEYVSEQADASTEIAYTAQLVDSIHLQLTRDQQAMDQKMQSLKEKLQNLLSLYPLIETLLQNEQDGLEATLAQLQKITEQNDIIHTHVKESRQIARKSSETVGVSQRALMLNEQKIHEIAVTNKTATGGIQSLSNKINGIWEIVDLIDSIADQTKIIAFNAELESEKIDQNRDKFKNVAYAIRNLTDQVLTLTGKIRSDIRKIQDASNTLLSQGKAGTETIENGSVIAGQLAVTLKQMENGANDSGELSEAVQTMIENFNGQVMELQKLLSMTQTQIESYKESIRNEIELAGAVSSVIGAEE
ncbi:MAG: methyl-accepting chemotaxis protein [Treponemataceae bacterium]|nr:methyl-accepting chemotaxis protein [Treponemataceae bacterium]